MPDLPDTPAAGEASSAKKCWFAKLGHGLITGAADDGTSGIATYSQAGAQFGYRVAWTLLLTYPLMVGIQLPSARGLAKAFSQLRPAPVVWLSRSS